MISSTKCYGTSVGAGGNFNSLSLCEDIIIKNRKCPWGGWLN